MRIPRMAFGLIALPALAIATAAQASHEPGNSDYRSENNCWGVVSSQRAKIDGGLGEHSSSQSTPRSGLGNVARALDDAGLLEDSTLGSLGSFLAEVDGFEETTCG